jgi:hypothetical protein
MFKIHSYFPIGILNHPRTWRVIHIIAAVFVCSYISFHVLDLDLSDFPISESSSEGSLAILETSESTELASAINEQGFRVIPSSLNATIEESIRSQNHNLPGKAPIRDIRVYLRLMVPRFSASESPPAA